MRTFIALELPEGFWEDTAALARQLESDVPGRFCKPETYHVTLAFLGDIGESDASRAIEAIDAACDGLEPVALKPEGFCKFGRKRDVTLGIALSTEGGLPELASRVREELHVKGVAYDDSKAFRAHITLARHAVLPGSEMRGLVWPSEAVGTDVTFFKSILDRDGATYKPLYTRKLG